MTAKAAIGPNGLNCIASKGGQGNFAYGVVPVITLKCPRSVRNT